MKRTDLKQFHQEQMGIPEVSLDTQVLSDGSKVMDLLISDGESTVRFNCKSVNTALTGYNEIAAAIAKAMGL